MAIFQTELVTTDLISIKNNVLKIIFNLYLLVTIFLILSLIYLFLLISSYGYTYFVFHN